MPEALEGTEAVDSSSSRVRESSSYGISDKHLTSALNSASRSVLQVDCEEFKGEVLPFSLTGDGTSRTPACIKDF